MPNRKDRPKVDPNFQEKKTEFIERASPEKAEKKEVGPDKKKVVAISLSPSEIARIEKFLDAHPNETNRSKLLFKAFEVYENIVTHRKVIVSGITISEF